MTGAVPGWRDRLVERNDLAAICVLNWPDRLNAITRRTSHELAEFGQWFSSDSAQAVAVLTGQGTRSFCTGADVQADLVEEDVTARPADVAEVLDQWAPPGLSKPWICAVNGVCAGGGLHFVAGCDFAIASENASFLDPHVSVGHVSELEPDRAHAAAAAGRGAQARAYRSA
jgi:enoyl-CoA hydratase/carnithine racemase